MRIVRFVAVLPLLVLGLTSLSAPSQAQMYISGNVGAVFVRDADVTETGPGVTAAGEFEFDDGLGVNAALGYVIGPVRLEGEVSYRQADIDTLTVNSFTVSGLTFTGSATAGVDGEASVLALMANTWFDFDTGTGFLPFLGGGIGLARVDGEIDAVGGIPVNLDDDDVVFAYQLGAGLGYEISSSTVVSVGYRFFGTNDPKFSSGGFTDETEVMTHNVEVGLRFRF